jgi:hypothetical protein
MGRLGQTLLRIKECDMIKVDSSNVKSVGYVTEENVLLVLFKNDTLYKYFDVPFETYTQLTEAESVGKFLNSEIKKNFECEKVWDDDELYETVMTEVRNNE